MFTLELNWKEFDICLDDIESNYRTDFPKPGDVAEGEDAPDHADLYYHGYSSSDAGLQLHFNKKPEGWNGFDENGDVVAPDASSNGEAVWDFWNDIAVDSSEATNFFSEEDAKAAMDRAREDAPSKTWDNLTAQQKKLVSGANMDAADMRQMITDFPEA